MTVETLHECMCVCVCVQLISDSARSYRRSRTNDQRWSVRRTGWHRKSSQGLMCFVFYALSTVLLTCASEILKHLLSVNVIDCWHFSINSSANIEVTRTEWRKLAMFNLFCSFVYFNNLCCIFHILTLLVRCQEELLAGKNVTPIIKFLLRNLRWQVQTGRWSGISGFNNLCSIIVIVLWSQGSFQWAVMASEPVWRVIPKGY